MRYFPPAGIEQPWQKRATSGFLMGSKPYVRSQRRDCRAQVCGAQSRKNPITGRRSTMIATVIATVLLAQQLGQSPWCWVDAHSNVMFCDYSALDTCRENHKGQDGTCVMRR
jgi:hypothetical protein